MDSPRDTLLRAALAHVVERGLADLSLRTLAEGIGTSHRMLIYHFGSKEGLVAEVVKATVSAKKITPTSNPLPIIPELTPTLSPGAESAQVTTAENAANLNSSITTTQSLYGYYQSRLPQQPNQTKQQVAFGYIYQLWKGRQTFSVETPWGFFTNMAIQSVQARQGPNTRFVSDFDITFKKIRTARSVTIVSGLLAGRATSQQAPTTQNGTIGQVTPTASQSAQFYQQIRPKSGG